MLFKKTYSHQEIVAGCVNNERFFQEKLYREFFPTMMRMCLRYTNDQDTAMHIVNNGFLRVYKKLDTFQFKGSLEGWIRKLVYHSLSDYFRAHKKQIHFLDLEDYDEPIAEEATSQLYLEELLTLVNRLPEKTQAVFRLYAISGYRHAEIAHELGISIGTSKWHLSEARKLLKDMLDQQTVQNNYAK